MELWIPITFAAAFCQNIRSALQRQLTSQLTAAQAAYVRFCYAVPFAWLYLACLTLLDFAIPNPTWTFFGFAMVGGVAQIFGTVSLIRSFETRNFTVGTAYSKTETLQTALFALVILGEGISWFASIGIAVSLVGVVLLSAPDGWRRLFKTGPGAAGWFGIGAGAGFGIAAVCFRAASLSLPDGEFFVRAALTVTAATTIQTLGMGVFLYYKSDGANSTNPLLRVARTWRRGTWVGLAGMVASTGWFTAMTLERAAYVRALGQVELLFAFVFTVFVFRERVRAVEMLGASLIVGGLILLVLW